MAIAEAQHDLSFIVQDRFEVVEAAREAEMPPRLEDRVEFSAHDFSTEEPLVADVYLFR